jgi:hypothetical protein
MKPPLVMDAVRFRALEEQRQPARRLQVRMLEKRVEAGDVGYHECRYGIQTEHEETLDERPDDVHHEIERDVDAWCEGLADRIKRAHDRSRAGRSLRRRRSGAAGR